MPKGEIVGRFTVGSKLVIDGKNNDGKDQRELKCRNTSPPKWKNREVTKSQGGRNREAKRNREGGRNREAAKSRSGEIMRRSGP
jgi:hypothetical protein